MQNSLFYDSDEADPKMRTEFNVETVNYYDDNVDYNSLNMGTNDNYPFYDGENESDGIGFNFEEND